MILRSIATAIVAAIVSGYVPTEVPRLAADKDLYTRVVDVGGGLCSITRIPGDDRNRYFIYDTGHWTGEHCFAAAQQIVYDTEDIDLFILSHSDSDHLGNAPAILDQFNVLQIVQTGVNNSGAGTWRDTNDAIANEVKGGASVINLQSVDLVPGQLFTLGDARVTLIAGWRAWTGPGLTPAERRNAVSIVARLEFKGKSILFGGDTVGRRLGEPDDACKDAEKVMVDRHAANEVSLKSDVIIAPHHGADNANSRCFIAAVDPSYVVFPAGHAHQHPTTGAANRYIAHGVPKSRIFRTDRGDDESGSFEWKEGSINNCSDRRGDDDVEIIITDVGALSVKYRNLASGC